MDFGTKSNRLYFCPPPARGKDKFSFSFPSLSPLGFLSFFQGDFSKNRKTLIFNYFIFLLVGKNSVVVLKGLVGIW
jgi:hypothetical protein